KQRPSRIRADGRNEQKTQRDACAGDSRPRARGAGGSSNLAARRARRQRYRRAESNRRHRGGKPIVRFIIQMARRELRASWRRLLFFFACIAVGVGAIAAGRSMLQNAHSAMANEARNLLTADVQLDSGRPWEPEALSLIDRITQPLTLSRTETI